MLRPDLVIRVMPPTVTITATAPAVPNSHAATGLLLLTVTPPFFPAAPLTPNACDPPPEAPAALVVEALRLVQCNLRIATAEAAVPPLLLLPLLNVVLEQLCSEDGNADGFVCGRTARTVAVMVC